MDLSMLGFISLRSFDSCRVLPFSAFCRCHFGPALWPRARHRSSRYPSCVRCVCALCLDIEQHVGLYLVNGEEVRCGC